MIKSLTQTSLAELIDCLLIAFEGYFVKMPSDLEYWKRRFKATRANMNYSYGYFIEDKLVAFIIHGIDDFRGFKVAFNTGTGVIPSQRGKQIVDKLYAFAIPELKKIGVEKLALEVITKNHRAISVYERIGFEKKYELLCFAGAFNNSGTRKYKLKEVENTEIIEQYEAPDHYSWDHVYSAISKVSPFYTSYVLLQKDEIKGYCFFNSTTGYIAQLELLEPSSELFEAFLKEISRVVSTIKMNNVFSNRTALIAGLKNGGVENKINQYEMWRGI